MYVSVAAKDGTPGPRCGERMVQHITCVSVQCLVQCSHVQKVAGLCLGWAGLGWAACNTPPTAQSLSCTHTMHDARIRREAYARPFMKVDMDKLFAEPHPTAH
jgi:hypothetical protein